MEKRSTILITGATGFVGKKLVRKLSKTEKTDFDIRILSRNPKRTKTHPNVEVYVGDVLQPRSLREALNGVDIVVHLAAEMDFFPKQKERVYQVNVEGTRNLVKAALDSGTVKRFIYCSTTETIGKTEEQPATEDATQNPTSEYGKSKIMAEKVVKELCSTQKAMTYTILRPTGIYGPGDRFAVFEMIQSIQLGFIFFIPGTGSHQVMFTYIDDVIDAFVKALNLNNTAINNQTYNICPNEALSYREWIRMIARITHRNPPNVSFPIPLVKQGIALLGPIMNLGKQRTFLYQVESVDRMTENRIYSNQKAKRELEWNPTVSPEVGIRNTVEHAYKKYALTEKWISPLVYIILNIICIIAAGLVLLYHYYSK